MSDSDFVSTSDILQSSDKQRRIAIIALLAVTLVWGATFIWMKQALDALDEEKEMLGTCLLYTSPSPRDTILSRMPSSA